MIDFAETIPVAPPRAEPRNDREAHRQIEEALDREEAQRGGDWRTPSIAQLMLDDDGDTRPANPVHIRLVAGVVLLIACGAGWAFLSGLTL